MKPADLGNHALNTIDGGVALLFSGEFVRRFASFQAEVLKRVSLTPRLTVDGNLPHITLYQGTFSPDVNPMELAAGVGNMAGDCHPLHISFDRFIYVQKGWFFLIAKREMWLRHMHDITMSLVAPFIVPPQHVEELLLGHCSPGERENFTRFGYRYAGESFLPHLTLGRLATENLPSPLLGEIEEIFDSSGISRVQDVRAISFYKKGENGAHAETLAEFELQELFFQSS